MSENNEQLDYDVFERDWKKRHKASLPRKVSVSGFSTWFWIGFWLLVATGAAVFSAAHTIPAAEMTLFADSPHRGLLASTAFVIVELVVFGSAVYRHQIWWIKWLLLGALLVALIANTSSSIRAVEENGGDMLNQVAGVLLSIIAPFTALAAGEVLHLQLASLSDKRRIANEEYQQQWKEVEAKINTAFTKAEKERYPKLVPVIPVNPVILQVDKPSPKMQLALEWLKEHPEHLETESRTLGELIGVSHTLANEARKTVKSQNGNSNGHNESSENGNGNRHL